MYVRDLASYGHRVAKHVVSLIICGDGGGDDVSTVPTKGHAEKNSLPRVHGHPSIQSTGVARGQLPPTQRARGPQNSLTKIICD